ncbi:hypothetical protein [Thermoactinomyces sp. DSM 45892]|uniref:hypothetical protein n=1 Tax=Thermoactinomyces sp. DSM 45892 TaxID=1882753 RepID=UPI000896E424|nr:hypothetical protein [Thermoactinomyces sp. DSM 45892]SDY82865.1 hypothetical protein SAMN05444416_10910 [Thermoactinomyces sp. DSM 45892]
MEALVMKKRAMFALVALLLLGAVFGIYQLLSKPSLTDAEKAAIEFYSALEFDGDGKTANELHIGDTDWTEFVTKKPKEVLKVSISPMIPSTDTRVQVLVYTTSDDTGCILDMVKENGWKVNKYKNEKGLYSYMASTFSMREADWKEVQP